MSARKGGKKGRVKELAKVKMASYWSTYKGWKINLKRKFTLRSRTEFHSKMKKKKKRKKENDGKKK